MMTISIKFQAYIPKSLGKPLLSYFEKDRRLSFLTNKDAFLKSLSDVDETYKGVNWIQEPGSTSYFFATDNTNIHDDHTEHTIRLGFHLNIEVDKIGKYKPDDSLFIHKSHNINGKSKYNNLQHSGLSHRVEAYIEESRYPDDMPKLSHRFYKGICNLSAPKRSPEEKLKFDPPKNYISYLDKSPATYFNISASADYPYTFSMTTPNIDFEVEIEIINAGNLIYIDIKGEHNRFPAYELIVNEQVIYLYDPLKNGQTGPGIINLNTSEDFFAHKIIWQQKK